MKKFIIAAAAALALASPAMAAPNSNFVGPRAELTAGFDDVTGSPDRNDVVYGAAIGIDVPVGSRLTLGIEGNSQNVFEHTRTIGAAARVGVAVTPSTLLYAKGGYSNYQDVFSRELDGATVGGGAEIAIGRNAYVKAEYKYSDFAENTGSHGALVGFGLRF